MSNLKSIIAIFILSIVFVNCKPKPAEKDSSKLDSVVTQKPQVATISEVPSNVFFKAVGTEPFWNIEITEDSIKFTTPEEKDNFSLSYSEPKKAMDANLISYRAKSDDIDIEITIQQGECSDGMSDKIHKYSVKVLLKRGDEKELNLKGCGNYIIDYRLHDIWALEELEGKKINPNDFKNGVPNLEIFAEEAKFSGMAGCNRISGKLFSEKELLRFTDVSTTEMMCDTYETEKIFVKALQSTTKYDLKDNKLYLLNPEGTKAVFRKVD
jgi:heat shock protein HslJ